MGFFNFFKAKNPPKSNNRNSLKLSLSDVMEEIRVNMYVDDKKTKKLFEHALKLTENSIIDRHFVYNQIIEYYYGLRHKESNALNKCIEFCKKSIDLTPRFLMEYKKEHNRLHQNTNPQPEFIPPRIPAFQRLAIIYENQRRYEEAIEVCKKAISLNLKDGTKTGFEGRILRIERKRNK